MSDTTWMNDYQATLESKSLSQLTLPGTHDSGTYAYAGMPDPGEAVLDVIMAELGLIGLASWAALLSWTITQERTFQQQMEDGIRYLDIRTDNDDGTLKIVHGVMPPCPKLVVGEGSGNSKGVVQDVRDFLKGRPREIVIMDFQEFQNMDKDSYTTLLTSIKDDLGPYLLGPEVSDGKSTLTTPLKTVWGTNPQHGQVIVLIDRSESALIDSTGLWNSSVFWDRGQWIASPWANTDDTAILRNFLYMENPCHLTAAGMIAVLQGQLTTITNVDLSSLKSAASRSNPQLVSWLKTGTLGSQWNVTIADFYNNTDYVPTIVSLSTAGWPQSTDKTQFWGGNVSIQNLSNLNKQSSISPTTDQGITAAVLNDTLYFFYRNPDDKLLRMATYDQSIWTETKVTAVSETLDQPPGVVAMTQDGKPKLLLVYKVHGDNALRSIQFDGKSWSSVSKPGIKSSDSPGLAAYADAKGVASVMAAYKADDSNDLRFATYQIESGTWTDQGSIKDATKNSAKIDPESDHGPAMALYNSNLYMLYKGRSSTIYQSVYKISSSSWSGNEKLSKLPGGIDPSSDETPALAVFGDTLTMVYESADLRNVYQATFDGSAWSGNTQLKSISNSEIDPSTNKQPSIAPYAGGLYLLFKGSHSNDIYAAANLAFHTTSK